MSWYNYLFLIIWIYFYCNIHWHEVCSLYYPPAQYCIVISYFPHTIKLFNYLILCLMCSESIGNPILQFSTQITRMWRESVIINAQLHSQKKTKALNPKYFRLAFLPLAPKTPFKGRQLFFKKCLCVYSYFYTNGRILMTPNQSKPSQHFFRI